ncbi:hypothetical protein [Enhygromyxa salina]|uniref:hypothetical protein n=1 Tax=Enhygromyxa salina TaxID=215803 RepID=UPI0004E756CA|nr:hypothetical protein [Enhygromyxa salina]
MPLLELVLLTHSLVAAGHLDVDVAAAYRAVPQAATPAKTLAKTPAKVRPGPEPFVLVDGVRKAPVQWVAGTPATRATQKIFDLVSHIDDTRTDTVYSHSTRVRSKQGVYHFDCSGMINWMLGRVGKAGKAALETLDRERPVAATYVRIIKKAPTHRGRGGWQQIDDIEDVEPGDLFAWKRPADWPKGGNTGHIGVVIAKPAAVAHIENAWVVRVIDSTRYRHQDDTRGEGETGFGRGTLLFVTDDDGRPIGYGWHGSDSSGFYRTEVVFGRVH